MTADKQETPRTDSVICPNCAHQFQAISMDHQAELTALRARIEAARREMPKMSVHAARWLDVNPEVKGYIDALRAKLEAERDKALEDAAKVCESQGRASQSIHGNSFYIALGQAARAIRALKSTGE